MTVDFKKRTEYFIKDLHAREYMRLGIYRQVGSNKQKMRLLRERKARHEAFLRDLLRKRGINPAWYAWYFYILGHFFGFFSRFLPLSLLDKVESTLEFWLLMRYKSYARKMQLDASLRSMVESLQLKRFAHDEPAPDAIDLLHNYIQEQEMQLSPSVEK
jgi:demethoxyubiquinone hydroxylase (CLK1/Coq7/Cat5 family)